MRITDFVMSNTQPIMPKKVVSPNRTFDADAVEEIKERLTRESVADVARSMGVPYLNVWKVKAGIYD